MLLNLKELQIATGLRGNILSAYAAPSKKKLIRRDDKKFDMDNPINRLFLEMKAPELYLAIIEGEEDFYKVYPEGKNDYEREEKIVKRPKKVQKSTKKEKKVTSEANKVTESQIKAREAIIEQDRLEREARYRKTLLDIKEKELKIKKEEGEMIDLKIVLPIVNEFSSSMTKSLEEELEIFVRNTLGSYKVNTEDIIEKIDAVTSIINGCIQKSLDSAQNKFKTL